MRRWLARLLLAAAAGVSALLALELGLRLAGISRPRANAVHDELGWIGRPGIELWHGVEGGALVRNNSRGFRDAERTFDKPPDAYRIAVLGDSYVAAYQVAVEERFTELLARALQARLDAAGRDPPRRVEVLNFGVNGFGTAQELLTWRHEASRYDPDLVLLAFFAGNDPANNLRELEQSPYKAYFELDEHGALVLDDGFRAALAGHRGPLQRLMDASRVLQLLCRAPPPAPVPHGPRPYVAGEVDEYRQEPGLRDEVYREPSHCPDGELWARSWEVTEALILALRDEVQGSGARFVLASVSTDVQVHPDPRLRARFAARLGVPDLDLPDRRLAELARTGGFPFVALAPPLRAAAEARGVYLHGFTNTPPGQGHWNALGHALAAQELARALAPLVGGQPAGS